MIKNYTDSFDWDFMDQEQTFESVEDLCCFSSDSLPFDIRMMNKITISRQDYRNFLMEIKGIYTSEDAKKIVASLNSPGRSGILPHYSIDINYPYQKALIRVTDSVNIGCQTSFLPDYIKNENERVEIILKFISHSVEYKNRRRIRTDVHNEWIINGFDAVINHQVILADSIMQTEKTHITRQVGELCIDKWMPIEKQKWTRMLHIKYANNAFDIISVQEGPKWSNNLCISFRAEYGYIPSETEREQIVSLLGFLVGKKLLSIGYAGYRKYKRDRELTYALSTITGGFADEMEKVCQESPHPPIMYHEKTGLLQNVFNACFSAYNEIDKKYNFSSLLWSYWYANTMPIGMSVPIYSNILQSVIQCWFKSNQSVSNGTYIEHRKYLEVINEPLKQIELGVLQDEDGFQHIKKITNKIIGANRIGQNETYTVFFDEIGMVYGKEEKRILLTRNRLAHGINDYSRSGDDELQQVYLDARGFRTIINRVFLILFNYDGMYIDYSTFKETHKALQFPLDSIE